MSDVLRAISSSPGELEPVFNAILENATRLCEAKFGILMMGEGDAFRLGAVHDAPQPFIEFMKRGPVRPNPHITFGRAVVTKRVAQIADITIEQPYLQGDPLAVAAAELGGYRTVLAVPMLKESEVKVRSSFSGRKCARSTRSRLRSCRISRDRLLSPSRMHGCSTNCANCSSSRLPLPTCSRSSADPHSICRPCSIR